MPQLSETAAINMAGGDVRDLETANSTAVVTAEHVRAAEKAAGEAEAKATASEHAALAGTLPETQASADREHARYTALRLAVTRRRAERHRQAERIRGLAAVGEAGLRHAAALRQLESGVLADLASIRELEQGIRDRIRDWNAELSRIIAEGAALGPEPPAPGGAVRASSAGVYASAAPERLTVKSKTLVPIDLEHVDGVEAAISAASRDITPPDPSMRLVVGENGVVVPMGRDPGGHLARKVAAGVLRELSPSERAAYLAGEQV